MGAGRTPYRDRRLPFSRPVGRLEFGSLESSRFRSLANVSILIPYRHIPIVTGMRFQCHIIGIRLQVIRRGPDTDFRTGSQKVLLTSFVFPSETGTFRIQTDRFAQVFCSQVHRNRKLVLPLQPISEKKASEQINSVFFFTISLSDLIIVQLLLRTEHRSDSVLSRQRLFRDG